MFNRGRRKQNRHKLDSVKVTSQLRGVDQIWKAAFVWPAKEGYFQVKVTEKKKKIKRRQFVDTRK